MSEEDEVSERVETGPEEGDLEELRRRADERDEYYNLMLRVRADLENFTKRTEKERARWKEAVVKEFVSDLLPVLDALHAAACHPEETDGVSILEGLRLMDRQMAEAFERNRIVIVEPRPGEEFDPAVHEAVMTEASCECPPGRIVAVLRRGFVVSDTLIRAAQVKVAVDKSEDMENNGAPGEGAGESQ